MQRQVQALVGSSLDYCNGLYYGVSPYLMNQLQIIQNRACRVIKGLKKKDSVDEHLQSLHWLKIEQRIQFKLLLLTYKSLNGAAPEYLSELLQYNHLSGSRTPSLKTSRRNTVPAMRSFESAAPLLWNALPDELRQISNIITFKKKLKTHLFKQSYPNA